MLKIRPITDSDCRLLWEWVNDPVVRSSALQSDPISWEEHVAWFHRKRVDPNCHTYILVDQNDSPIGQVRFDIQADGRAEVDISIAPGQRGQGYGTKALQLACEHLCQVAQVTQMVAHIKPQNVTSRRAFEKAGFKYHGREYIKGHEAVRMEYAVAHTPGILQEENEICQTN